MLYHFMNVLGGSLMSISSVDKKSFKKLAKTISNYWFKFYHFCCDVFLSNVINIKCILNFSGQNKKREKNSRNIIFQY